MIANSRRLLAALLFAGALSYSGNLPAQNKTVAESLFQAGKQLMTEKKYAEACPKFAESQKLDPSPGTLLNLGRCYEALGKTASAWAEYKAAAALAAQLGQKDREQGARDLAKELEPKLSKLTITATTVPGLVVKNDGVEIGTASLGIPLFTDPGDHVLEASAPGYEPATIKVTVGASGDTKTAAIPPLVKKPDTAPGPTASASTTASAPGPSAAPSGTSDTPPPEGGGSMRTASYVLMGVGVASIGVGAVMGGLAAADVGNAQSDPTLCPEKVCTPKGREVIDGAGTKALVSTIALPVGLAAAGAGVVLFVLSAPKSSKTGGAGRKLAISPFVGPDGASFTVRGQF